MRKLILKNFEAPGDAVVLTGAIRDIHRSYPGEFLTDVRTSFDEIWEGNPHLTALDEGDPVVEAIDCRYPTIEKSNDTPVHYARAFIDYLNERLDLKIEPSAFGGDIYLSEAEKQDSTLVERLMGKKIPFWIIVAGGKNDYTVKWWAPDRYQEVVDRTRGKLLFVQVGRADHFHPDLDGVLDLRGKTSLRELIKLVWQADGVLCPMTLHMHLAAAVPGKDSIARLRPCVVVAGGREPPHWSEYPGHQLLHTIGALDCCRTGGCWRSRTARLGDGDVRDTARHRCVDVVGSLPRCMDLLSPNDVIDRIAIYYRGGTLRYLTTGEAAFVRTALRETVSSRA